SFTAVCSHLSTANLGPRWQASIDRSRSPASYKRSVRVAGSLTTIPVSMSSRSYWKRQCSRRSTLVSTSFVPDPKGISMKHWPDPGIGSDLGPLVTPAEIARSGLCVGCGSCAKRMQWDKNGFLKPRSSSPQGASFALQCPFSPRAPNEDDISKEKFSDAPQVDDRIGRFEAAYVGYVAEPSFRRDGSSGGLTSWVAAELL